MKFLKYSLTIFILINNFLFSQIKKENIYKTVEYLASEKLQGRLPGSVGYKLAAEFISNEFSKLKLKPINKNYFQKQKVEYNEILSPEHFAIIKNGNKKFYELGKDYVYRGFTGSGKFTSQVVFCGYGLSQPNLNYDDYENIDVKDKTVMVFKYNPRWTIKGKNFTDGNPREKAIVAAKHGAKGILFVSFPNDKEPQKPIGSVINGNGEQMINFPEIHIDLPLADELFEDSGFTLKDLQTKIDSTQKPFSVQLKHQIDIEVNTNYEKEKEVENIAAILEGDDINLKNEYLIIGAHLDHVGSQAGKIYFTGANDNASGSAVLLEVAKELSKSKNKRSIIFVFFASEEQGLNGSTFFAQHLPFPKEKIKAMINIDCVGFGDSIQVGGGKSAPQFWQIAKSVDELSDKLMINETWSGGGADAEPFYQLGIPTLYFVSKNSYKHLHMLSDKPETLNQQLMNSIANLILKTALEIVNK
ncbi:MAG: M20/M25/M40 family metallo-hydrolase [Melioribacteraceae bacterium]|nr:M20/M25/M40 family metallo-hydrolase [Melioribacteraceae bacterium]